MRILFERALLGLLIKSAVLFKHWVFSSMTLTKTSLSLALALAHFAAAVPIAPRWKYALLGLQDGKKKLTFDTNGNFKVKTDSIDLV